MSEYGLGITDDQLKRVELAIEDYKNGKMVIMVDDADRENE